jgi:hypothetical protein
MPISNTLSAVFIHIPRTGGTTIEKILGIHREWPDLDRQVFHGKFETDNETYQLQHLNYTEMKAITDISHTDNYFKFSFVRNPWDRLVSEYFWKGLQERLSFKQFVSRVTEIVRNRIELVGNNCHLRPQSEFITSEIQFVGKFESFSDDLNEIFEHLHLESKQIPSFAATEHEHYANYYNAETSREVYEVYRTDIERFEYEFD